MKYCELVICDDILFYVCNENSWIGKSQPNGLKKTKM